jgi:hypothetical protein
VCLGFGYRWSCVFLLIDLDGGRQDARFEAKRVKVVRVWYNRNVVELYARSPMGQNWPAGLSREGFQSPNLYCIVYVDHLAWPRARR